MAFEEKMIAFGVEVMAFLWKAMGLGFGSIEAAGGWHFGLMDAVDIFVVGENYE